MRQVHHVFIDADNRNEEVNELPEGTYQVIGDPVLVVTPDVDPASDEPLYIFKHRVGRIG